MAKEVKIIYEDEYLLIADKPAGLLVIPTAKNEEHTLVNILNKDFINDGAGAKLHPCHRIDRETSGLIIFAKGKVAQQRIMELFHRKEVKKAYLAIVQGKLNRPEGVINFPIEGKPSITKYKVLSFDRKNFSLVRIETITGRTNQIRIHFKMIGHPLVGERRFAFAKDFALKFKRAALHANFIQFVHPFTKQVLKLSIPLAQDMEKFITG